MVGGYLSIEDCLVGFIVMVVNWVDPMGEYLCSRRG